MTSMLDVGEDATLHKAKQKFLQHLEEVDTSEGIANTLVLKFRLDPEVESALNAFVTDHGCSMESRVLTREEQDKIDKRQKNCAQHTWFLVTPEAQEEYLKNGKRSPQRPSSTKATPKKATPKATPTSSPRKKPTPKTTAKSTPAKSPRKKTDQAPAKRQTPESEEEEEPPAVDDSSDQDTVKIPLRKFDDLVGRLASALLLLPTVDIARGTECRETLVDVAHEMRELRPTKRRFVEDDDGEGRGESSRTPAKAKKRRL